MARVTITITSVASAERQIITIESDSNEPTLLYGFGNQHPIVPPSLKVLEQYYHFRCILENSPPYLAIFEKKVLFPKGTINFPKKIQLLNNLGNVTIPVASMAKLPQLSAKKIHVQKCEPTSFVA